MRLTALNTNAKITILQWVISAFTCEAFLETTEWLFLVNGATCKLNPDTCGSCWVFSEAAQTHGRTAVGCDPCTLYGHAERSH